MPFRRKARPKADMVVVVADLHCNSTVGLCPPAGVVLDDGGEYRPSPAQRWLWQQWRAFWHRVDEVRQKTKPGTVYVVVNGDATDLNVHDGLQLITQDDHDAIADMAATALLPARAHADHLFIVRGTRAHTGSGAQLEELTARRVDAEPDGQRHTWAHLRLEVQGVTFSFAHHPLSTSFRQHTRSAAAERCAVGVMLEYARRGGKPPDVAVRAHCHWQAGSGITHPVRAVFPGAWQLCTEYGYRLGHADELADVGGLIFVCQDGRYTVEPLLYTPEREAAWQPGE